MQPTSRQPPEPVRFGLGYLLLVLGGVSICFALVTHLRQPSADAYLFVIVGSSLIASAGISRNACRQLITWSGQLCAALVVGLVAGTCAMGLLATVLSKDVSVAALMGAFAGGLLGVVALCGRCYRQFLINNRTS